MKRFWIAASLLVGTGLLTLFALSQLGAQERPAANRPEIARPAPPREGDRPAPPREGERPAPPREVERPAPPREVERPNVIPPARIEAIEAELREAVARLGELEARAKEARQAGREEALRATMNQIERLRNLIAERKAQLARAAQMARGDAPRPPIGADEFRARIEQTEREMAEMRATRERTLRELNKAREAGHHDLVVQLEKRMAEISERIVEQERMLERLRNAMGPGMPNMPRPGEKPAPAPPLGPAPPHEKVAPVPPGPPEMAHLLHQIGGLVRELRGEVSQLREEVAGLREQIEGLKEEK